MGGEGWERCEIKNPKNINLSPLTLDNKTYPKMQNMTETHTSKYKIIVSTCLGQSFLTSSLGQYVESVQLDALANTRPLQSSYNNE